MNFKKSFLGIVLTFVLALTGLGLVGCGGGSQNQVIDDGGQDIPPTYNGQVIVNNVANANVDLALYDASVKEENILRSVTTNTNASFEYQALTFNTSDAQEAYEVQMKAFVLTVTNNSNADLGVYFWNKADTASLHNGVETAPLEAKIEFDTAKNEKSDILYGHHLYGSSDDFDVEYEFYNHVPAGVTETMHVFIRVNEITATNMQFKSPIYLNIETYVPNEEEVMAAHDEFYENLEEPEDISQFPNPDDYDNMEEYYAAYENAMADYYIECGCYALPTFVKCAENGHGFYTGLTSISIETDAETGDAQTVVGEVVNSPENYRVTHLVLNYNDTGYYLAEMTSENSADIYFFGSESGYEVRCPELVAISLPESLANAQAFVLHSDSLESIILPDGNIQLACYNHVRESLENLDTELVQQWLGEAMMVECGEEIDEEEAVRGLFVLGLPNLKTCLMVTENTTVLAISGSATFQVDGLEYVGTLDNAFYTLVGVDGDSEDLDWENIIVHDGCEIIAYSAFAYKYSLVGITLPESLKTIENSAFWNCRNLTSIVIPDGVENIGVYAFSNCSRLTYVAIPESVENIGYQAFGYCNNLVAIYLPSSVGTIGWGAFYSCNSNLVIYTDIGDITEVPEGWDNSWNKRYGNYSPEYNVVWDSTLDDYLDYVENLSQE